MALHMGLTFHSLLHMQDAAHIMMTLAVINFWWIDCFIRLIKSGDGETLSKNFYVRYPGVIASFQRSTRDMFSVFYSL